MEVAKKLIKIFGLESQEDQFIQFSKDRTFSEHRFAIDASKLHRLGWHTQVSFEDGLMKTSELYHRELLSVLSVQWYKANFNNWDDAEKSLVPHPRNRPIGIETDYKW